MTRIIVCILTLVGLYASAAAGEEDESCLECHGDRAKLTAALKDKARAVEPLLVDREKYGRSVHAAKGCADCHFDYDTTPHSSDAESATCSECHEDAAEAFKVSVHAKDSHEKLPVACGTCHGVHDVLKPTDRDARLNPLNVYKVCGQCHFSVDPETATTEELLRDPFTDDSHARGILLAGLGVSATCVSCHGGHGIRPSGDPLSRVARVRVHEVCGECHIGVVEQYQKSVHHLRATGDKHEGATCSDCHFHHEITARSDDFRRQSANSCANCHDERGSSFKLTYHGQIQHLGYGGGVATCASCHDNHLILPAENPQSKIHPKRLVATCGQCHEDSHEEFTKYVVHADPSDGERYPRIHFVYVMMNTLLICVLILGGLHALLWLVRATAAGEWRRPKRPKVERWVRRWPRIYVAYHMTMMFSVLTLASTGLPLHFADKEWAHKFMAFFGGPDSAGYIHRAAAIALVLLFAGFGTHMALRIFVDKEKGLFSGPNTMLPRRKDIQDLIGNLKWFLFLAPRPAYDRWTYWEKFDFWAATWGLFIIGTTGTMLWWPEWWTRIVPGWFLNAAVIIHGIEALLDIAFIFTVHVFHANLRPDKFPLDTMFYTGRVTEQEFRHERPLEYERAFQEGRIEQMLAARSPRRYSRISAYVIGSLALAVGLFFVAMMIVAVVQGSG
jgi:cytochrome b subunit of formate dehydrogenase